jgi:pimeloyl-ACP methyl ester carboxylesterase
VEDTLAAVAYLRTRKEIDPRRIGLVGHSEGGIVAPRAAAKSPEVAFIVLLAGVGVPMEDLLLRQARDISLVMGMGEDLIARNEATQRELFRILQSEKDPAKAEVAVRKILHEKVTAMTDEQRKVLGMSDAMIDGQIKMILSPWFRDMLGYDPRPTLRAVKCPVLAINGEKDLQVGAKENLPAIREALAAGGNPLVKTVELPGLNHLFQTCETGAPTEYNRIEETFNPAALKLISDWIHETTSR